MNPWHIDSIITHAKDLAARNGFRLEPGTANTINMVADKAPYGKNVVIGRLDDWRHVEVFFAGYEQQKMEATVCAGLNKP